MNSKKARFLKKKRSKLAASEVMGAVLMLAVTLAVGFAVWAWARGDASSAEKNYGASVVSNINCLNQNFVISDANFSTSSGNLVTVWYYNNGNGTIRIGQTLISNSTWVYSNSTSVSVAMGIVKSIKFNAGTNFHPGSVYTFKGIAQCQGDIISTYQQVR
jgi:hypothetical protein